MTEYTVHTPPSPPGTTIADVQQAMRDLREGLAAAVSNANRSMADLARATKSASAPMKRLARLMRPEADRHLARLLGVPRSQLDGIQFHLNRYVPDGDVYVATVPLFGGATTTAVVVGTYRDELDDARDEARLIVRRGMADVLAWLGEDPEYLGRSKDILRVLGATGRDVPVHPSP